MRGPSELVGVNRSFDRINIDEGIEIDGLLNFSL
jgi:hypothetical protein